MSHQAHIAIDLGAESGRVMVGWLESGLLTIEDVHRFKHRPLPTPSGLCWDITGLWQQILSGLSKAEQFANKHNLSIVSIGADSWGVDWSLVSTSGGVLLGLPRCYRDSEFPKAYEQVIKKSSKKEIYESTGIQLMEINSLYQLHQRYQSFPKLFENDSKLVFIPDIIHWLLSGQITNERTISSTSQMIDVRDGEWNFDLLKKLNLPTNIFSHPINPGDTIGNLTEEVAKQTNLNSAIKIIAPPAHDTASAVAAIPETDSSKNWAYLSSGTWSLLGVELKEACINSDSFKQNFTNELGINNTVRFLKNLSGLWLVQELRRQFEQNGKSLNYTELTSSAKKAKPFRTLIPVADSIFAEPGNMIDKFKSYAKQTNQPVPETVGQLVRCALESLALSYKSAVQTLENLLSRKLDTLHIVGGGTQNQLLNQMTANATGLNVTTGPVEATAMGNILTQAMGTGSVKDLNHIRSIVAASAKIESISPNTDLDKTWEKQHTVYTSLPPYNC